MGLWKGKDATPYYELVQNAEYVEGAREVILELKARRIVIAIVTTGPKDLALRIKRELGVDYIFANELVIRKGKVTGEFVWPLGQGGEEKARIVKEMIVKLGIGWQEVAYIGDHDNDIAVCRKAGISIGFNPSEKLKAICKYNIESLKEVLKHIK